MYSDTEVGLYEMPRPHGRAMGVDQTRTFSSNDTLPIDDAIFDQRCVFNQRRAFNQRCGSSDDTFRVMMRQPRRGETHLTAPEREQGETSERPGKSPSGATPFFHCTRLPNRSAPFGAIRPAPNRVPRLAPWAFKTVPPLRGWCSVTQLTFGFRLSGIRSSDQSRDRKGADIADPNNKL